MKILRALSTLMIGCLLLMALFFVPLYANIEQVGPSLPSANQRLIEQPQNQSGALPDLVIDRFTLEPTTPITGASVKIIIRVRNLSPVTASGGFRTYLYIDPVAQPPITETEDTQEWGHFVTMLPYGTVQFELEGYTFEESRNYKVYAWVDRDNKMQESNESNNLSQLDIPVSPGQPSQTLGGDDYEPDDLCDQATEIPVDGTAQFHFFRDEDTDAQDDVDWVKFNASAEQLYLIRAVGTGAESSPELELREGSCDGALTLGTASSISFTAAITGVHYLKLKNDFPQFDPDLSEYRLTVLENPDSGGEPSITHIEPNAGRSDRNTKVTIRGANFDYAPSVELHPYVENICHTQALTSTSLWSIAWLTSQELLATVPANLEEGTYCLSVTNIPNGKATVEQGFIVFSGAPDPRRVSPKQSYNDLPSQINLYGFNFTEEITVRLSNGQVEAELSEIQIINRNHLRATIPAGLKEGSYDLEAFYEGDEIIGKLDDAITLLLATGDDLFALDSEFWLNPDPPYAGSPTQLVLGVHRQGGQSTIEDVKVRFFVDHEEIGDSTVGLLSPNRTQNTTGLEWLPSQPGSYTITAQIDPLNLFAETSESNNTITKTITVLKAAPDQQAPRVDMLEILGGQQTISERQVWLDAQATDYPLSGGTEIAQIRYIELEYSQGARIWHPIQDSDWLPYTTSTTSSYNWLLSSAGGIHYIQAWAKDGAGNISIYPNQTSINYLPGREQVERGQRRLYRQALSAGETLEVTVRPFSGDPDLYIWPPNWEQGKPPWVSNQPESADETLTFQAPISGSYQIEVYGYTAAEYELELAVQASRLSNNGPSECNPKRECLSEPVIPVDSQPPTIIDPIIGPLFKLYLPSIMK